MGRSRLHTVFAGIGTAVLLLGTFYWCRTVLVPIAFSILFTLVLAPVVAWLQRRGLHRVVAVLLATGTAFLLFSGIVVIVLLQLKGLASELPKYKSDIAQKIVDLRDATRGSWLEDVTGAIDEIGESIKRKEPRVAAVVEPIPVTVTPSGWSLFLSAGSALEMLVSAGLVVILVFFMLVRREDLRNRLIRLSGDGNLTRMTKAIDDATGSISRFLFMQLIINGSYGLILALALFVFGVPYSILWGFLAALLRYIPYLGPWIGALFPIGISAAVSPGWTTPLLVIGVILALELLTSNLVEPILFGQTLGISEVALLVSAAFWTWLWGPMGLVLAAPLTACLVVAGRFVPSLSFLATLLGSETAIDPEIGYYQRLLARDQDEALAIVEERMKTESPKEVFEHLLLPALVRTKQNEERGDMTPADSAFIYRVTAELLDDLESASHASGGDDVDAHPSASREVLAWAADCPADQLGLRMLHYVLDHDGVQLKILPPKSSIEDIVACIDEREPASICMANVPPGALAPIRYLCRRLRGRFPKLKLMISDWGQRENIEEIEKRLAATGADRLATNLTESRDHIRESLPVLSGHAA